MPDERRRSPRVKSLNFVAREGQVYRTLDLSAEGLLLEMSSPPPVGSPLYLRLAVGEQVAELQGQVVRHVPLPGNLTGVGVHLQGLDPGTRALLEEQTRG